MPVEVVMPKFGLTMQEGTIQQWFKAAGEPIDKGEPLFEVETEKVLYEVAAPASGRVATLFYPVEATVSCAAVVAVIAVSGEDPAAVAAQYASAVTPQRRSAAPARGGVVSAQSARPATAVTPAARKLAKEHGIDLGPMRGTGPGGRITREDIEAVITRTPPPAGAPLRGIRKAIAEHMFTSLQSTAQLTITTEADVTALVAGCARLRSEFPVTYTDLLVAAVARVLRDHPRLNATATADAVRQHESINIGVAVALEEGLVVPVIRSADQKSLRQIAEESHVLAEKARAGTLGVDEVSGGTFTISNLGMYGVDAFTPILNTPQVAILGVGRIVEKPSIHGGEIVPRSLMVLSLTVDHRVVDGAPAAAFLRRIVSSLQS